MDLLTSGSFDQESKILGHLVGNLSNHFGLELFWCLDPPVLFRRVAVWEGEIGCLSFTRLLSLFSRFGEIESGFFLHGSVLQLFRSLLVEVVASGVSSLSKRSLGRSHLNGCVELLFLLRIRSPSNGRFWRRCSCWVVDSYTNKLLTLMVVLKSVVLLDLVPFMSSSVKGQLPPLPEPLLAAIYAADVRLLSCMDALVLLSVLIECKSLSTESALECFLIRVDELMSG